MIVIGTQDELEAFLQLSGTKVLAVRGLGLGEPAWLDQLRAADCVDFERTGSAAVGLEEGVQIVPESVRAFRVFRAFRVCVFG